MSDAGSRHEGEPAAHYLERELYERFCANTELFDFLQAGSLDGLWYWDLEHPEHEWLSPRFWEVFGYDPATKQHLASEWQDMIHPDDLQVALENLEQHLADENVPYDQYVRYRHQDGSTVWIRCRGIAIRDENGKPIRMLGAHTDVTAMKAVETRQRTAMEEELARANAELARSNEELERFAYVAAHELQQPLRMVASFATLLQQKYAQELDDQAQRYIHHAVEGAKRMHKLVDSLLRLSRVGTTRPTRAPVDTATVVQEVIHDLRAAGAADEARFVTGTLPELQSDRTALGQVFQNLIGNALKFRSEAPPEVTIDAEHRDRAWVFRVTDTGVGIAPEDAERVFGLFERLHSNHDRGGAGIGLSIVKRIVERLGGKVWLDSKPGEGSTFFFSIPHDRAD